MTDDDKDDDKGDDKTSDNDADERLECIFKGSIPRDPDRRDMIRLEDDDE